MVTLGEILLKVAGVKVIIQVGMTNNFVFGYGSLVCIDSLRQFLGRTLNPELDFTYCGLKNFHRCWNVAMDNRVNIPGYKYYINKNTGDRLDGFVAFLNIRPQLGKTVTGILFRTSHADLEKLDNREYNYERVDITHKLDIQIQGRAWVYIGLDKAEQCYQEGLSKYNASISQTYFDLVHNAYRSLGEAAFSNYISTTDQPTIPILELERHQISSSDTYHSHP